MERDNKKVDGIIDNVLQAYKALTVWKKDVVLKCIYHNRGEKYTFKASNFGNAKFSQYIGFKHQVDCMKRDFKEISTYYRGNKKDCKFKWEVVK
jgi:hypothetical protein